MWLYGYVQTNFNIYMEILRLCSSLHCLFFTLIQKWGVVGDLENGGDDVAIGVNDDDDGDAGRHSNLSKSAYV